MDSCTVAGALEIWKIIETDVAPLTRDAKTEITVSNVLTFKKFQVHIQISYINYDRYVNTYNL